MHLDLQEPRTSAARAALGPYLGAALEQASSLAARLAADEVALEHLVEVLVADEDSALARLVVHAFADPETIALDVRALAPGILVVAPDATLPFSPRALAAAHGARERASAAGRAAVGPAHLLAAALAELPAEVAADLGAAGLDAAALERACAAGEAGALPEGAHLFHPFDAQARRALASAARQAAGDGETSIAPARVLLAALAAPELEAQSGLSRSRAGHVLRGRTADDTPPPARALALAAELAAFLDTLPAGAGSLDVLARLHVDPASELTQAFTRQKVSPALLERARGSFLDPGQG